MAEQMDALKAMFAASEEGRSEITGRLGQLADAISEMNMRDAETESITASLDRVASGQEALLDHLRSHGLHEGMDAESRMRLRSIDVQMLRILEEISAGRQESMAELRTDIELLAKALSGTRRPLRGATRDEV